MALRHGWFVIPGKQTGDRTIEEQMEAVRPATLECQGKRVLDLGCAEGLVSIEFLKAGAHFVQGMEGLQAHVNVAHTLTLNLGSRINIKQVDLLSPPIIEEHERFDIVLALGIIHKLHDPEVGLRWALAACKDLFLIRSGLRQIDGIITSKHHNPPKSVDSHAVMRECGFELEKELRSTGKHAEMVHYWRRK